MRGGRGKGEEGEGKERKKKVILAHKHGDHRGGGRYETLLITGRKRKQHSLGTMLDLLCTSFIAAELTPPSTCIGSTPDWLPVSMATALPGELTKPVADTHSEAL